MDKKNINQDEIEEKNEVFIRNQITWSKLFIK